MIGTAKRNIIVQVCVQEGVFRVHELGAHQQGGDPRERKEHEPREDVAPANVLVIDCRQPADDPGPRLPLFVELGDPVRGSEV
jgi:hypothetical protein